MTWREGRICTMSSTYLELILQKVSFVGELAIETKHLLLLFGQRL